ncbi:hypothetical protein DFH94DRAFT_784272 [Russula ochroleuca]|uniref:DUF6533 domain-containing protein n=1 Tax=Russula ochroleuca TaxID=152965 RepID=A0A9P5JVB5_9AGAM|nr:hypothetical protein DFH94DRAFT_784272 [Russula ochroleuca]
MSTADINAVANDYRNSVSTKYVGVAAFTVLVWDHLITFSDEVEYIWKGGKGLAVYLFLVNRYLIPLSFIVNIYLYFSSSRNQHLCAHAVRYEGAMTMIGISIVFTMMFLRIRALYRAFMSIQAFVLAILLTFIGVNSYVLTHGIPVKHLDDSIVDSCTMIVDPKIGRALASSTAWLPLLYDTVIVSLTLYRTASSVYSKTASNLLRVLLREGLLYYRCVVDAHITLPFYSTQRPQISCSVICTITLILTIMIDSATQSIRNITSQYARFGPHPLVHARLTIVRLLCAFKTSSVSHRGNDVPHYTRP